MLRGSKHIALLNLDKDDLNVFRQLLDDHPDRLSYEIVDDIGDISPDHHALLITRKTGNTNSVKSIVLENSPMRIGSILDDIESLIFQDRYGDVVFGNYNLDWQNSALHFNGKDISLTERERYLIHEILGGGELGRDRDYLLDAIWGYRSDLDTHTLETHIYRLRQKIEDEPDSPKILLTTNNGYKIV